MDDDTSSFSAEEDQWLRPLSGDDSGCGENGDSEEGIPTANRFGELTMSEVGERRPGHPALWNLRLVLPNEDEARLILKEVLKELDDPSPHIRCDILKFLPLMALVLSEDQTNEGLRGLISEFLLPGIVKVMDDSDEKILKMADSAFVAMLEHSLVQPEDAEKVCSLILKRVTRESGDETSNSVISMMRKTAPWVGSDVTKRLFVPLLVQLSGNSVNIITRRLCACIYGEICTVVGTDVTETTLVPAFLRLCRDSAWEVRRTCTESFMSVSFASQVETRRTTLCAAFRELINDSNKYVRFGAFQSLGPFITTFAEPSITAHGYNRKGELVLKHRGGEEFRLDSYKVDGNFSPLYYTAQILDGCTFLASLSDPFNIWFDEWQDDEWAKKRSFREFVLRMDHLKVKNMNNSYCQNPDPQTQAEDESDDSHLFNPFFFWRDPLPTIDLPEPLIVRNTFENLSITTDTPPETEIAPKEFDLLSETVTGQNIVPAELMNYYASMCDPRPTVTYEPELASYCAYNLPAVALTLGTENWPFIKKVYEKLAADSRWRVRRVAASYIHELALIVGEDIATQDLAPIFTGFIGDLDDVRIGALSHLATFLKLLKPPGRNSFLPRLHEFLALDQDWKWRLKEELAEQLIQCLGLFPPYETFHHLNKLVFTLLQDKVADVRKVALSLMTELVNHVSIDMSLLRGLLAELAQELAHSSKWSRRQTFAFLCSKLLSEHVLSDEMFGRDVLPHLLDLSWDRVPNVRIAVARTIATELMANQHFSNPESAHHELIISNLKRLHWDQDRDVRYYASLPASSPERERS